ncbi:MAG: class I SAM-dependent methyltransferase [bacterium]|nr:class I SAM-dependent methyltransferase [bacterium]
MSNVEGIKDKFEGLLEDLKKEFSRSIPNGYRELAATAELPPTAPSYSYSVFDILSIKGEGEKLAHKLESAEGETPVHRESLTKMGQFIQENLRGNTLIDLGAGDQIFVQNLARSFGVKRYIGVDIEGDEIATKNDSFEKYRLKDDMLLFVSKLPDNYGSFFIAGAEDYSGGTTQIEYTTGEIGADILPSQYMEKVLQEVYRATRPGGLLIVGANNTLLDPETVGYKFIRFENTDEETNTIVYIKEMPTKT